jgi:hypothetical protein
MRSENYVVTESLRRIAMFLGLVAIGVLLYVNHHGGNTVCTGCGLPIRVLVAKREIPKGTGGSLVGSRSLYKVVKIPSRQVQTGALTDPSAIANRVALTRIHAGQQFVAADFGAPVFVLIPGDESVSLKSPKEVGGPITIGSYVEVLVNSHGHGSRQLFRRMYVLDTDTDGDIVSLEATPKQAAKLHQLSRTANYRLVVPLSERPLA